MTAELVIMNKEAIAIAADSAVTIGRKIYTTNKVFMFSKFCPVGIMIYGNGQIMGVPWEPIIKRFRDHIVNDKPYKNLDDYANCFVNFLNENTYLFPELEQKKFFAKLVLNEYSLIKKAFLRRADILKKEGIDILNEEISKREINSCINKHLKQLEISASALWKKGTKTDIKKVSIPNRDIIDLIQDELFKEIKLDIYSKRKLERVAALSFYNYATGVVIAGFGTDDLFPVTVTYGIGGLIDNKLVYEKLSESRVTFDKPAHIIPFAQSDVIETYLNGIDPEFDNYLQNEVIPSVVDSQVDVLTEYIFNDLKEELEDPHLVERLKINYDGLKDEIKPIINNLKTKMMRDKIKDNRGPIETAIEFLPKDELAVMAESLLTLTSLKRRYSIFSLESVGGDIDVAVISKSDGFVWIKRKHYFDERINHHFFHNYFNKDVKH